MYRVDLFCRTGSICTISTVFSIRRSAPSTSLKKAASRVRRSKHGEPSMLGEIKSGDGGKVGKMKVAGDRRKLEMRTGSLMYSTYNKRCIVIEQGAKG